MWVDYTGDVEIINENGKEKCVLSFKKCGWFGEGRYEVTGEILDAEGRVRMLLIGKWNEFLCAKKVDENGKKVRMNERSILSSSYVTRKGCR